MTAALTLSGQIVPGSKIVSPQTPVPQVKTAAATLRPGAPAPNEIVTSAVLLQEMEGPIRKLRVAARLETTEMLLTADEIDYNEDTGEADARGTVTFQNFQNGEKLEAVRMEYNLREETGRFYDIKGSAPAKVEYRPGLLMTTNPFIFQGRWAEKIKNRYILYDGFVTNCKIPKPWWRLSGPKFDIIPGERALAFKSYFKVRRVPVLYTPVFYKSLEEEPRRSGFLTPNAGRSNRLGWIIGGGYFWAINRSYDAMYRARLFTERGTSHEVDFRGKPRAGTEFGFSLYGVHDRGRLQEDGTRFKEGGYQYNISAKSEIGDGWTGFANINYLSSFLFRQAFTQSFNEAIFSAVNSIGYVSKSWSSYSFHAVISRHQFFQGTQEVDQIVIRKLPSFEFFARDSQINKKLLPVWFSMESSAGFFRRRQLLFETPSFTERLDASPRLTTAVDFKGFRVLPSITLHGTAYGSRLDAETFQVSGQNLARFASDIQFDIVTPTLEKTFDAPKWIGGKLKHVIEPRLSYHRVDGVNHFRETIRFDEIDIVNSTSEAELGVINRIFAKRGDQVEEILTWQVWQRRYFDPTFGGAVVEGQRNVFASTIGLTGYAFFNGPRNYSPVVSALRLKPIPRAAVEWRADYDPLFPRMSNSSVTADVRIKEKYSAALGHNQVRGAPGLSPNANQLLIRGGYGFEGKPGWRAGFNAVYDYRINVLQYATTEISYNSDCCGLSFQHRHFNFGTRYENQYLVSFSVANIGSFGTLRKQERLF
jgi:LPS-assembly protein